MKYKHLAGALVISVGSLFSHMGNAATYDFSNIFTGSNKIMDTYSSTWVEETEVLTLSSTWDASANIDRVRFLLSDGGSPHQTPNEQFLYYSLDLVQNKVDIYTYFDSQLIETHDNILDISANGVSFSLDHTLINQMTFGSRSFNGAGFDGDIGIWYYMDSNGKQVETYDVHHATTVKSITQNPSTANNSVPEPATLLLLALGFVTMTMRKVKLSKFFVTNPSGVQA